MEKAAQAETRCLSLHYVKENFNMSYSEKKKKKVMLFRTLLQSHLLDNLHVTRPKRCRSLSKMMLNQNLCSMSGLIIMNTFWYCSLRNPNYIHYFLVKLTSAPQLKLQSSPSYTYQLLQSIRDQSLAHLPRKGSQLAALSPSFYQGAQVMDIKRSLALMQYIFLTTILRFPRFQ